MQQANNPVLLFLIETIKRFSAKSPLFFRIWQIISGILVLITGLPEFLHMFNIHIPELWDKHLNDIISWVSRGLLFMSLMTSQSPAVAMDENGVVLKKTNDSKLPFTAKQEIKSVMKKEMATETPIPKVVTTS